MVADQSNPGFKEDLMRYVGARGHREMRIVLRPWLISDCVQHRITQVQPSDILNQLGM